MTLFKERATESWDLYTIFVKRDVFPSSGHYIYRNLGREVIPVRSMEEKIDTKLVELSRAGDKYAFNLLLERYQVMASCIALRLVPNEEIAHELVQEAMLQAYLSLDHLRDDTRFKSWFYGIVVNVCRHFLSHQRIKAVSLNSPQGNWLCEALSDKSFYADPQEIVEEQELQQLVREAVDMLSPRNRDAAVLFYYDNLSTQEIAAYLGISLTAVRNRLYKARDQLRGHLKSLSPQMQPVFLHTVKTERRNDIMIKVTIARMVQEQSRLLLLFLDEHQQWAMPYWIWYDGKATSTTLLRLRHDEYSEAFQPLTLDFITNILNALGATLEALHLDTLRGTKLYAIVHLRVQGKLHRIKASINDALTLALCLDCPLFIAKETFESIGIDLTDNKEETLEQKLEAIVNKVSFTPVPVTERSPRNLDFNAGLHSWYYFMELYQPQAFDWHIDTQVTRNGSPSLAITLQGANQDRKGSELVDVIHEGFLADDYCGKCVRLLVYARSVDVDQAYFSLRIAGSTSQTNPEGTLYTTTTKDSPPQGEIEWTPYELVMDVPNDNSVMELSLTTTTKDSPLQGTTEWTPYELVLGVPDGRFVIEFSLTLKGKGQVWLNGIQFEVVNESTPIA